MNARPPTIKQHKRVQPRPPREDRRSPKRNGPSRQTRARNAKYCYNPGQKQACPDGSQPLLQGRVPALAPMPVPKTRDRVTEQG